jgi:hypothetical protein
VWLEVVSNESSPLEMVPSRPRPSEELANWEYESEPVSVAE